MRFCRKLRVVDKKRGGVDEGSNLDQRSVDHVVFVQLDRCCMCVVRLAPCILTLHRIVLGCGWAVTR